MLCGFCVFWHATPDVPKCADEVAGQTAETAWVQPKRALTKAGVTTFGPMSVYSTVVST